MSEPTPDYRGTDFYCDIALPQQGALDIVYNSELVLAFRHTKPYWEQHVVVVPKQHISSLLELGSDDGELLHDLLHTVQLVAADFKREFGAARIVSNLGRYQDSKHLHVHIGFGPVRDSADP